jgi:IS30 family transposase
MHRLSEHLRRSLTWDHSKEMAECAWFTVDTRVPVYFCDPRGPWQRPATRTPNRLLRQYLPRTDVLNRPGFGSPEA